MTFILILEAFEAGYARRAWATYWPRGVLRWAYEMGRRQVRRWDPPESPPAAQMPPGVTIER